MKLAMIVNRDSRKTSYKKRKQSLMKKLDELSILCDLQACAIIKDPFEPKVEVWPKDNVAFQNVLNQFMTMSAIEKSKKMTNNESYIKKRIRKVEEQLNKQIMMNRDTVVANMLAECLIGKLSPADLNLTDLNSLVSMIGNKITEIVERIELLKGADPAAPPPPPPESQLPQPQEVVGGSNTSNHMVVDGMDVDCYAPVMEKPGASDGMQTNTEWDQEWFDSLVDPDWSLVPGDDLMKPFPDDPNPFWSGATSPKTS